MYGLAVRVVLGLGYRAGVLYMIILSGGFGQEFFFVSASVCNSRNWNSRSNRFA